MGAREHSRKSVRAGPRRVPLAVILLGLLPLCLPARSDVVILRNKERIEGKVTRAGDKVIVVTRENRTIVLRDAEVQAIERAKDPPKPKDFRIPDDLRRRVEQHRRMKRLGAALQRGGKGAANAAEQLSKSGPDALPWLAAAFRSKDKTVAAVALRGLGAVGTRGAADVIIERLPRLSADLQIAAVQELGRMRASHAAAALDALLRKPDAEANVRQAAVRVLGILRSDLALPALLDALARPRTAQAAADALVALGSASALPYLEQLVDKNDAVARAVARIIRATAGPEHATLLLRLKRNDHVAIRQAAMLVLRKLKEDKASRIATYVGLLGSKSKREAANAADQLRTLTNHDARGRKAWVAWWVRQNRPRLRIAVVPIGDVEKSLIRLVARAVETETKVKVSVLPKLALSRWARVPGSRRLRGDALLDRLDRGTARSPRVIAAIGVTAAPVELPGSGPVIGGFRCGKCGLVSLAGLEAGRDPKRLRSRLVRYALHVLARALRVRRAKSASCPAGEVYEPAGLDRFDDGFSEGTAQHVAASVAASAAALAGDFEGAIKEVEKLGAAADPRQHAVGRALWAERKLDLRLARRFWIDAAKAAGDEEEKAFINARLALIGSLVKSKK